VCERVCKRKLDGKLLMTREGGRDRATFMCVSVCAQESCQLMFNDGNSRSLSSLAGFCSL
jgi:hypothetical protein